MKVRTATVAIAASPDRVFDYLADPLKHPEWATEFIKGMTEEDGVLWAETLAGRVRYDVQAHPETRVVDIVMTAPGQPPARIPTRVVALGPDAAGFAFTLPQAPGTPDEKFEDEFASLERELANLSGRFEGR